MVSRLLNRLRPVLGLQDRLDDLRFRGSAGRAIKMHRAMRTMELQRGDILSAFLLPVIFDAMLALFTPTLIEFWHNVVAWWVSWLGYDVAVGARMTDLGPVDIWFPNIEFAVSAPTPLIWWVTLIITVVTWLVTLVIPRDRYLPLIYLLRALVLLQWSALAFFGFFPASIPTEMHSYMSSGLASAYILIMLVPWIHGLTFYVFDFGIARKVLLTVITLAYLMIFAPLQYTLHAVILNSLSVLFLPMLYILMGTFLNIYLFISFYGWGMSWLPPGVRRINKGQS